MKYILLSLLLTGCGSATIDCWYGQAAQGLTVGEPYFTLVGRTGPTRGDVYGPKFRSPEELDAYVKRYNLKMCAVNR